MIAAPAEGHLRQIFRTRARTLRSTGTRGCMGRGIYIALGHRAASGHFPQRGAPALQRVLPWVRRS